MTEIQSEQLEHFTSGTIDRRAGQTWTYVGAVAAGLIPVFISPGLWIMPILAMAVYAALAHGPALREGAVFEFADAFYYLGFTLSVGSLLAALDPFHLGADIDAKRIFHLFGLGMLTTIIGVVGRTGLQIFYRSPSENLESTNRRLIEEAEIFLGRLRNLSESIATTAEGTAHFVERRVGPSLGAVGASLDALRSQIEGIADVTGAINSAAHRSSAALEAFATAHEQGAREATKHSERLITSQGTLAGTAESAMRQAASVASSAQTQFQATENALLGVRTRAAECQQAFANLSDRIATVQVDATPVVESVKSLSSALSRGAAATDQTVTRLDQSLRGYESAIGRLDEAAGSLASHQVQPAITGLAAQLESMAGSLRKHAQFMSGQQFVQLEQATQRQVDTVQRINATLDEIVDAATRRLHQMQ